MLIQELDHFIDGYGQWLGVDGWGHDEAAGEAKMLQWLPVVTMIADRVLPPGFFENAELAHPSGYPNWNTLRQVALSSRGYIERGAIVEEALGPAADVPQLAADRLHPNVWGAARPYWEAELYAAGVEAAAKALNAIIQHKSRRSDLDGTDLVNQVLSPDPPGSGQGKLVVRPSETTKTADSVRQGVHALGRACYQALRNPIAHETDELDEQVALEQLATLSLFARFVDQAVFVAHG